MNGKHTKKNIPQVGAGEKPTPWLDLQQNSVQNGGVDSFLIGNLAKPKKVYLLEKDIIGIPFNLLGPRFAMGLHLWGHTGEPTCGALHLGATTAYPAAAAAAAAATGCEWRAMIGAKLAARGGP